MSSKFWMLNAGPQPRLYAIRKRSLLRKVKRHAALLICAGMLLAVVLLLSGCHHQPIKPCETPQLPTQPALSEPLPSVSYSISVGQRIKNWGLSLTGTPQTLKP